MGEYAAFGLLSDRASKNNEVPQLFSLPVVLFCFVLFLVPSERIPRSSYGDGLCLQVASGQPVGEGLEKLSLSGPLACTPSGLSTLGNCRRDWACLSGNA